MNAFYWASILLGIATIPAVVSENFIISFLAGLLGLTAFTFAILFQEENEGDNQ